MTIEFTEEGITIKIVCTIPNGEVLPRDKINQILYSTEFEKYYSDESKGFKKIVGQQTEIKREESGNRPTEKEISRTLEVLYPIPEALRTLIVSEDSKSYQVVQKFNKHGLDCKYNLKGMKIKAVGTIESSGNMMVRKAKESGLYCLVVESNFSIKNEKSGFIASFGRAAVSKVAVPFIAKNVESQLQTSFNHIARQLVLFYEEKHENK